MKGALDPLLRRHEAGLFGGKIDARLMADAELDGVVGEAVNTETHADVVEKDVTGFQDRIVQTERAVRLRTSFSVVEVAVILAAKEGDIAGAEGSEAFFGNMLFEHGGGGHNFENGAWRELCLNGAVQERMQRIVVQGLPLF